MAAGGYARGGPVYHSHHVRGNSTALTRVTRVEDMDTSVLTDTIVIECFQILVTLYSEVASPRNRARQPNRCRVNIYPANS